MEFKIEEDFLIDGKKTKLISGAVHYFRIVPTHWKRTLQNLKIMGCNCVETYIPWNLHEPRKGEFDFGGLADIEEFIRLATELDLYIIVRPSPYICAEWDFGGLPAWLLKDGNMRVRSMYKPYLKAIEMYYKVLLPHLSPYQSTRGGNILMMQIENEYGSYGEDKDYLRFIENLMRKMDIDVPLFTSDGGWQEALEAGALTTGKTLATVNFGSDANRNFKALRRFQDKYKLKAPLMCMEFWDGWFNSWGDDIIRRDSKETAEEARKILQMGSINFYMFQGGTNFGFYNGTSDGGEQDNPQITSYDYDAPLTEWGYPTEKYFSFQRAISQEIADMEDSSPILPEVGNIGEFAVTDKVSLFSVLNTTSNKVTNDYPLTMEKIDQNFGYILYHTVLKGKRSVEKFRLIDVYDRAHVYINQQYVTTLYRDDFKKNISFDLDKDTNTLDILVENMGRNNYGPKLVAKSQSKGIQGGVMEDIHYISGWDHYSLEFSGPMNIDYSQQVKENTPTFYRSVINLEKCENTFLDCSNYGKGIVLINGENIGRYWNVGPVQTLFIPDYFWKEGTNEVTIFETEGVDISELIFSDKPIYASKRGMENGI